MIMGKGKSVSIVIPAFNEAENITATLREMAAACDGLQLQHEIIVVDDNSDDGTGKLAADFAQKNANVRILRNSRNLGFGGAFWRGVREARMDCVMMMVADDAIDADSIQSILQMRDQASLVIPYIANSEARALARRILSAGYVALLNMFFGLRLKYYNGHNVVDTALLRGMTNTDGFAYAAQYVVRLLKSGHTYVEVPMRIKNRVAGSSKAFQLRNIFSVVWTVGELLLEIYLLRKRYGLETNASLNQWDRFP